MCPRERKINDETEFLTWGNYSNVVPFTGLENKEQGVGVDGREGERNPWGLFKFEELR